MTNRLRDRLLGAGYTTAGMSQALGPAAHAALGRAGPRAGGRTCDHTEDRFVVVSDLGARPDGALGVGGASLTLATATVPRPSRQGLDVWTLALSDVDGVEVRAGSLLEPLGPL